MSLRLVMRARTKECRIDDKAVACEDHVTKQDGKKGKRSEVRERRRKA